jgi:hypothetical protein
VPCGRSARRGQRNEHLPIIAAYQGEDVLRVLLARCIECIHEVGDGVVSGEVGPVLGCVAGAVLEGAAARGLGVSTGTVRGRSLRRA